jgi:hypothetical protein
MKILRISLDRQKKRVYSDNNVSGRSRKETLFLLFLEKKNGCLRVRYRKIYLNYGGIL